LEPLILAFLHAELLVIVQYHLLNQLNICGLLFLQICLCCKICAIKSTQKSHPSACPIVPTIAIATMAKNAQSAVLKQG